MHVHIALVGDETDGAVSQPVGTAHILDRVAERQLEDRDQAGELGRRRRQFLRLLVGWDDLDEINAAAGRRFEWLFLVGADRRHPEFVDWIGQQQYLDAARAKPFELRAALDDIEIFAGDRIDRLLPRSHRRDIVVQRYEP